MKKLILLIFLILLITFFLSGKVLFTFEDILNPNQLIVSEGKIYIVQDATLYAYSVKNGKLLFKFGKKGEGPGEFNTNSSFDMTLGARIHSEYIFLFDTGKICKIDHNGKVISEKKIPFYSMNTASIGNNFIAKKYEQKGNQPSYSVTLLNTNLQPLSVIKTQVFNYSPGIFEPITDYLDFRTYRDKIYLLSGGKEIKISVLNSLGVKLRNLKFEIEPISITEKHKSLTIAYLKEKTWYKMIPAEYKKKVVYPKFLPACKNFMVSNGKIYIHTFNKLNDKTEFLIVSVPDKSVKSILLPVSDLNILEYKPYSINNNKFFRLKENKNDIMELHVEEFVPNYKNIKIKGE